MKVCSKPSEIRGAVRRVKSSHIAVAFLGADWREYINIEYLEEVVISTMLGSNPRAIEELMEELGHENVHFLDNLHAKVYLGDESAFIGSTNLSRNGFSDSGHQELGIELTDEDAVRKVRSTFKSYVKQARELYPTEGSKRKKLKEMYVQWQRAISAGLELEQEDSEAPHISGTTLSSLDKIHIGWHRGRNATYNEDAINKAVPESVGMSLNNYLSDGANFLESDGIKKGDWVILWECKDNGFPRKSGDISWLYVDNVISNGVVDEEPYTKLAIQIRSSHLRTEPFLLNDTTKAAIRAGLKRDEYSLLRTNGDEPWSVNVADSVRDEFFESVRNEVLLA